MIRTPKTLKEWLATIGSGIGIIAAMFAGYLHMHTDAEAAAVKADLHQEIIDAYSQQAEINEALKTAINRSEILRLRREVKRLERDKLNPNLSLFEITSLQTDIDFYNGVIKCIQAGHKVCL